MLELFKDKEAPPAAAAVMPRVKDATITQSHYVRVKYNDKVLELPQCQPSGQHHPKLGPSFCKLTAIFDLFQKNIPSNYAEACAGFVHKFGDV